MSHLPQCYPLLMLLVSFFFLSGCALPMAVAAWPVLVASAGVTAAGMAYCDQSIYQIFRGEPCKPKQSQQPIKTVPERAASNDNIVPKQTRAGTIVECFNDNQGKPICLRVRNGE